MRSLTVRVVDISRREYCIVNNLRAKEQNRADDCWLATPSLTGEAVQREFCKKIKS